MGRTNHISAGIITGVIVVDSGATLMARIRGNNGNLITQASVSTITYTVRDLTAGTTVTSNQSLTVSDVVFDSLQQNDASWTADSQSEPGPSGAWGYNFRATIPASHFASFDVGTEFPYEVLSHVFRIDVEFVPVSGQSFRQPFQATGVPTWP